MSGGLAAIEAEPFFSPAPPRQQEADVDLQFPARPVPRPVQHRLARLAQRLIGTDTGEESAQALRPQPSPGKSHSQSSEKRISFDFTLRLIGTS